MSPERAEKVEQEIARSREAQAIIDSPIYADSMKRLKQGIIDTWAACPARDTDGREWLWQQYQVALKFEETLVEALNTGKLAIRERELSTGERLKRAFRR